MEYNEFKAKLDKYLTEYEILNLQTEKELEKKYLRMYEYMVYILEKNQYINVTAIKEEHEFIKKHIIDSLYILKYLKPLLEEKGKIRYLDVGTGGGFPLIPIKIFTGFKVYGLDSILKKLKVIDEKEQINIIHERAEKAAHNFSYRETFDLVTTRAVSSLENVIKYTAGFVKINKYAILLRGKKEEIDSNILKENGFKLISFDEYELFGEERSILILKKIKKLNPKLPITDTKHYKAKK